MITLNQITFTDNGKTIRYDYEVEASVAKYFRKSDAYFVSYDRDVSMVPQSIAVIPFLANIMPIAWFVGIEVYVESVDATFYRSLQKLKNEFAIHFPGIKESAQLYANQSVNHTIDADHSAILFSGGLDSFESVTRNLALDPYLISVLGADIDITETARWSDFQRFNHEEAIVKTDKLCYITSNLRKFYTYEVDLLVDVNWWGKIQHGMALIGIIAPLSYLLGIRNIFIASSNTGEVNFGWGSTSETDEKVKWANTRVVHDGFHLRRTEKIQNIVDFAKNTGHFIKLRVCYSDLRVGYNCSVCTKCQRTMLGLILSGANPNDFGFEVPSNFYKLIFKNFNENAVITTGVLYEWRCLQDLARVAANAFVIANADAEKNNIDTFAALPLEQIVNQNVSKQLKIKKAKYLIVNRFPKLFNAYLQLRRKL